MKDGMNPELQKAEEKFEKFDAEVKEMTMDRMNMAPKPDVEPQTKLSSREVAVAEKGDKRQKVSQKKLI